MLHCICNCPFGKVTPPLFLTLTSCCFCTWFLQVMYLHQTLPQVRNCPLLTLYMSCGECVVRSLPKVLVFLSGDPWLWDWILSCVLEVSVSGHLQIPIVASCSSPPPQSTLTLTVQRKGEQKSKVLIPRPPEMCFQLLSRYLAVLQLYCVLACNCLIPQEQSTLGFYFCEFVAAVYLFVCLREPGLFIENSQGTHYIDQIGFEPRKPPPGCRGFWRCMPPCPAIHFAFWDRVGS